MSEVRATFWVLFHSERGITTEQVEQALRALPRVQVELASQSTFVVHDRSWPAVACEVFVCYEPNTSVRDESEDIADLFGLERSDKAYIATCDRRFEISYDIDVEMDCSNAWIRATNVLQALVPEHVLFDLLSGRFP